MTTSETFQANDKALHEMYRQDVGHMTEEDAEAYRELIAAQRADHTPTTIEVKGNDGVETAITVRSIGDKALHNAVAVHAAGRWDRDE